MLTTETDESTSATWDTARAILVDASRLESLQRGIEDLLWKIGDESCRRTVRYTVRYSDGIDHTTSSLAAVTGDLNTDQSEIVGIKVQNYILHADTFKILAEINVELGRGLWGGNTVRLQVTATDRAWAAATRGALRDALRALLLPYDERSVTLRAVSIFFLVCAVVIVITALPALQAWQAGRQVTAGLLLSPLCMLISALSAVAYAPDWIRERLVRWLYPLATFAIGEGKTRYEMSVSRRRTAANVFWVGVVLALIVGIAAAFVYDRLSGK